MSRPCHPGPVEALSRWYLTPLGEAVAGAARDELAAVAHTLFGYHALQLGAVGGRWPMGGAGIRHRVVVAAAGGEGVDLIAPLDALPVAGDSVGALLLPHTLELAADPREVLREAQRVLLPDGQLLILGFNPWSVWGARRLLRRGEAPWCGRFFGTTRLADWLALLGFRVEPVRHFFFRPPLANPRLLHRLAFVERLGGRWWPPLGGLYLLVARKRVIPLTPVKPRWRPRRGLIGGLAEPSARNLPGYRREEEVD